MFSNKILYKVAILSTLLLTFGILSDGGNLVQAQTPGGIITTPPGGVGGIITTPPGGVGAVPPPLVTTPPGGVGAPGNVTALNVYDNSTMVLEFGNGTTLASPYSNVWRIMFLPAGNQTIGNIPTGGGIAVPPSGGIGAMTPPPPGAMTPPPVGTTPPGGVGGIITTPPGGVGAPGNVTALNVYDNSTMVLEFGNGTTLASPYSNVWRIMFLPAGNQTIGNIPTGGGIAVPPSGGIGAMTPPPPGAIGGIITTPPGGVGGIITTPPGGVGAPGNVTALNVYDNSTMVLEFGNGTTLASPYSNVWR